MKNPRNKTLRLGVLALALVLCAGAVYAQPAQEDLNRVVSLGDSLTAAFISGSLHEDSQDTSWAKLFFKQATNRDDFEQPTVSAPGIPAILQLRSLDPLLIAPVPGLGSPTNLNLPRPYDNLAVPGANVNDILTQVTDGGGLTDLILRGQGTQVQQALALQPGFVLVWGGSNDALGAATSGIVIDGVTLTPLSEFEDDYDTIIDTLAGADTVAGGALGNVPAVTSIPFVTTIPPFVINPETNEPVLIGGNPVPLIGPDGLLSADDFVLLTASGLLAQGIGIPAVLGGTGRPLPDTAVLDAAEASTIQNRIVGYNQVIANAAERHGWALVDTNGVLADIAEDGLRIGGIEYSSEFLTGGLFSFDGVHPTQMGYAISANEFIKSINSTYGLNVPLVNLSSFVFGSDGTAPGFPGGGSVGPLVFSKKAYRNLRFALGTPGPKRLRRLKKIYGGSEVDANIAADGSTEYGALTVRVRKMRSKRNRDR